MADTFQLELVSPERLLLSRQVEMAVIPSAEGEMGVLPGHAPMIVALRGGIISVRENGAESERLFVAGGFAEVAPDRCTVLADEVTPVAQLSRAAAEARLREAEAAMAAEAQGAAAESPERREAAMARLLSARAMVAAAEAA
jgi:F-type H+-transporting ATPase subunit epsilon